MMLSGKAEIFISEIYSGPLKWILVFLPTGILTTFQPVLLGIMTTIASRLTDFENYETDAEHEVAVKVNRPAQSDVEAADSGQSPGRVSNDADPVQLAAGVRV